jgi:hypothetical protein
MSVGAMHERKNVEKMHIWQKKERKKEKWSHHTVESIEGEN